MKHFHQGLCSRFPRTLMTDGNNYLIRVTGDTMIGSLCTILLSFGSMVIALEKKVIRGVIVINVKLIVPRGTNAAFNGMNRADSLCLIKTQLFRNEGVGESPISPLIK